MIKQIHKVINGITITADVELGLSQQVEVLLDTLPENISENEIDEYLFEFGMFVFKFKKHGIKLYNVLTPDWIKNPLKDWTTDLSLAFALLSRQVAFMKHVKIESQDLRFDQKVICDSRAFGAKNIYLQRQAQDTNDSGWYIGVADDDDYTPDYCSIHVFELFEYFPYVIDYLQLPEDYLLVFHKNTLVNISDGEDHTVDF